MENNQIIEKTIIELVANNKTQINVVDLLINYINSLTDDEKEEFMERAEREITYPLSPYIFPVLATSKQEWWDLVRADLAKWNRENHPDDRMGIQDWIYTSGSTIHGGTAFRDRFGDWDVALNSEED